MRILTFLIVGILSSVLDTFIFADTGIKNKILNFFGYTIGINTLSLFVIRFLLNKPYVLSIATYKMPFIVKYILFSLSIGLLILFVKGLILGTLSLSKNQEKMSIKSNILTIFSFFSLFLGSFLFIGTVWFIKFFGKLTPEQFLFNFHSPVTGTASDIKDKVMNGPVLLLFTILVVFFFIMIAKFTLKWHDKKIFTDKAIKSIGWIGSVLLLFLGISYSIHELQLVAVYHSYFDNSSYIKNNYKSPSTTDLSFPKKKRNLIHIYLESYENSYFDKTSGGYMAKNLMPDFEKLYSEGISFSESDKKGGPYQTYGSSWSVASMVNMSTGLPLKIPMGGNSYGKSGYFLPGAVGIGDILDKEGYNQTVMFGADANFGGLTSFFNNHHNFNIYDVKYARKIGKIPKDYNVWWGFEDKKLYTYAQEEIIRLAGEGKPFNFTMENADTHFPHGYIEKDTERPFDNQYANVIFHSQKQVVDFVEWIQKQPFYKETMIVLTGDHLSMDKEFFKDFNKNYHRSTVNLIINGDFTNKNIKTTNRHFAPFDMYPTILSGLGVQIKGSRLGLGTDLTSNEKTLIERDSLKKVNEELSKSSKYYNTEFVSERKKPI